MPPDVAVNEFRQGPSQRFGRDSFETRSTQGSHSLSRGLARIPYLPVGSGERAECYAGWAALYLRWLSAKLGGLLDMLLAHHDDVGDGEYYGV